MAGVIQEIDLVLGQQAVAKATAEAEQAGAKIGQAAARGMDGTRSGARYVEGLKRAFALSEADTREALARGLISPEQARQRGADAARAFNTGILSEIQKLPVSGSQAGQTAFIGLAGSLKNVEVAGERAHKGLNTVRGSMLSLAAQAINTQGPIGSLANGLLLFAGGGAVTIAIAAGLAIIAKGYELLTSKAREAKKATADMFAELDRQITERKRKDDPEGFAAGQRAEISRAFAEAQRKLEDAQRGRGVFDRTTGGMRFIVDPAAVAKAEDALRRLQERAVQVGINLTEALDAKKVTAIIPPIDDATDALRRQAEQIKEIDRLLAAEGKRQMEMEQDRIRAEQAETERQQKLASDRETLMLQLRKQLAATTPSLVDDLELELGELQRKIIETFGAVPAELQPLLDDYRRRIQEAKDATAAGVPPVAALKTNWEGVGDAIARVAQGILDMANGLGIVDQQTSKVLQGFIGVGKNLSKALTGDPTAIIGAVGGLGSILGGAFGGQSPEVKAMNDNIRKNIEALRDNTTALEGATASQTKGAIEVLTQLLAAQPAGAKNTGELFGFANLGMGSRDEIDQALRALGSSMKELEEVAKLAGIDISDLSRHQFVQLLEMIADTDIASLEAAEAQKKLAEETQKAADAANAAAEALRRQETFRTQRLALHDITDPLGIANQRAEVDRLIPALASTLGHNLGNETSRQAAEAEIQRLFEGAGNLTTFQRGGLSVEDFRALLVEWEQSIDAIRQASEDEAKAKQDAATDQRRINEETQVANRQALEDRQAFEELQRRGGVVGGAAQQAVERAARLIAEAVALSAGPLGTSSPLFLDAQRRADEARAEAERLVGDAEQKKAGDITPGFTVQRTITESSAGRVIGELTTSNVWLEKIYGAITGRAPGAAPWAGGPAADQVRAFGDVVLNVDGAEIARVVGVRQAGQYQLHAGLAGSSNLPSV